MSFLRGKIEKYDEEQSCIHVRYETHDQESNGRGHVQGGFTAAMLDAAMAYQVMVASSVTNVLSTLEQKQTYFRKVPLNQSVLAVARCVKLGKEIAFMEATLYDEQGKSLVSATQTGLIVPLEMKTIMSHL